MKVVNKLFVLVMLMGVCYSGYGQITSAGSGNWSETTTWVGGVVPTSTDDVIIDEGHTVTVDDANAVCNSLSFGDATASLNLSAATSVLSVYGNFNPFSISHVPVAAWTDGAKLRFTGSAATQTITNMRNNSTALDMAFFKSIVVDKSSGKVTYSPAGSVLNISNSLEINSGTFEIPSTNDINGRSFIGTDEAYPTITVQSGGTFDMLGGASHIAARAVPLTLSQIGMVTIYGTMNVTTTSTNKINFGSVSVEGGGVLRATTGWSNNLFKSGTIVVKSNGTLRMSTTSNIWDATSIVNINSGGYFYVTGASATIPPTFNNSGIVRYSLSTGQTINGITYNDLWLENNSVKTLGGNITVNGTLLVRDGASIDLNGFAITYGGTAILQYGATGQETPQTTTNVEWPASGGPSYVQVYNTHGVTLHDNRTLSGTLTLTLGQFDNNGSSDDKNLTLADGATISRARGSIATAPIFGSSVNVNYTSGVDTVITGPEIPVSTNILNSLSVTSSRGMILGADIQVNGALSVTGNNVTTNAFTLTLGPTATISESVGKTVVGNLTTTRTVAQNVNNTLGGIGVEINAVGAAPGETTVLRKTGTATSGNSNEGIKRYFDITPATNTGLDATLVYKYDESELNSIDESNLVLFKSTDSGTNWSLEGGIVNTTENSITKTGVNSFSRWTAGNSSAPLPVELTSFNASIAGNAVVLSWKTATELNSFLFEIERLEHNSLWQKIGEVDAHGNSNSPREYTFAHENLSFGKYQYRLKIVDIDGSYEYSNSIEVSLLSPTEFSISQNYPNPFNPSTKIDYVIKNDSFVNLELFNSIGEKIQTLVGEAQSAGYYTLELNSTNLKLASGVYLVRFIATETNDNQKFTKTIKLILNK